MGALTVLLPCAVTQAMMLLAIASGSGVTGAAIMFSFILGTSPLFFILGYSATTLTEKWSNVFQKVVAVIVLFVAFFTILTGTTLAGLNISLKNENKQVAQCQGSQCPVEGDKSDKNVATKDGIQEVTINISDSGYSPANIRLKMGIPVKVTLKTENTFGCARAFVVPSLNIQKTLPKTGVDSFGFTPNKTGQISFTCSMGMYRGQFEVVN
jgi:hypothetical protein